MSIKVKRGMSDKSFRELYVYSSDELEQMRTVEVGDSNSFLIGFSDNYGRRGVYDINLIPISSSIQKKLERLKSLNDNALINLWNDILKFQREVKEDPILSNFIATPAYDIGTMTTKEARNTVENEMKNRAIRLDFSFYYNNYKSNIKRGR